MSKAFTKEDTDDHPAPRRTRSATGLPPGAVNYLTAEGARRLGEEQAALEQSPTAATDARLDEVRRILRSATIVPAPAEPPAHAALGATVTIRTKRGEPARYRIVGVDEADLAPGWVSWQSPLGRALIGSKVGERVTIDDASDPQSVTVVAIEY